MIHLTSEMNSCFLFPFSLPRYQAPSLLMLQLLPLSQKNKRNVATLKIRSQITRGCWWRVNSFKNLGDLYAESMLGCIEAKFWE